MGVNYRFDAFGKIRKIWGDTDVVTIPDDLDDEAREKLFGPNLRWTFDNIIFECCEFDFTLQTYVFIGCRFRKCDMSGIIPSRAILTNEITGCINVKGSNCPPTGDFTGYKIAFDVWTDEPVLITLHVPKDADRRGNGFDKKFRVSHAQVVDMRFSDGAKCQQAYSGHNPYFSYTPDCMVYPKIVFDRSHVPCASGIHMFLDPEDAINYAQAWGPRMGNVPRFAIIGSARFNFGLFSSSDTMELLREIQKEDGPCPHPLRVAPGFPSGNWEWVEAERKDR